MSLFYIDIQMLNWFHFRKFGLANNLKIDIMNVDELLKIQELIKMLILSTKETYTLDEVATLTGFKKSYLYNKISRNEIPHYKPTNGQVFIDKEDLTKWIKQNKQEVKK